MNKVICDVCGTDYPETEPRCPICDCVRGEGGQTSAGNTEDNTYTYVRGGRFSKSNVKKRLKAKQMSEESLLFAQTSALDEEDEPEDDDRPEDEDFDEEELDAVSNKGLIIVVIVLLLAIVAVASYLVVNYLKPITERPDMTKSTYGDGQNNSDNQTQTKPCTSVKYPEAFVELNEAGQTLNLKDSVTCDPADTTDKLQFSTGDEAVVTVDQEGVVTAVASGRTVISIRCGSAVYKLDVICDLGDVKLELIGQDITLDGNAPTAQLYYGIWNASDITWTSSNESVVIVKDGKVEPVAVGYSLITAEYKDQSYVCIVRVDQSALDKLGLSTPGTDEPGTDEPGTDEPGTDEPGTDEPGTDEPAEDIVLKLRYKDVTLDGVYPSLQLYNGKLNASEITWTSSKPGVATVKDGLVTAVSLGSTKITAEYKDQKVTCMIHVSQAALDKLGIGQENTPDNPDDGDSEITLQLKKNDITLDGNWYSYQLYGGELNVSDITWTSADDSIATVKDGLVTAVSVGHTVITAEYKGQKVTCDVHVSQAAVDRVNGNQQDTEATE